MIGAKVPCTARFVEFSSGQRLEKLFENASLSGYEVVNPDLGICSP